LVERTARGGKEELLQGGAELLVWHSGATAEPKTTGQGTFKEVRYWSSFN